MIPELTQKIPFGLLKRLNKKTIIHPITNCWMYTGTIDKKGYGHIRWEDNIFGVHRIVAHFELGLNLDDETQLALHKVTCFDKSCWHPEHIYIGTAQDNADDMAFLGTGVSPRRIWTHCIHGHPLSGDNLYIAADGRRRCKTCRHENTQRHDATRTWKR